MTSMAEENPNFSARPEQVEGKWKSLTLALSEPAVFVAKVAKQQKNPDIFM